MIIRLCEKFHAPRFVEPLEGGKDVLSVFPALVDEGAGEREGDGETRICMEQLFEECCRREVTFLCDFPKDRTVFFVIEVVRGISFADVRDPKIAETIRLMHLKVETDGRIHRACVRVFL